MSRFTSIVEGFGNGPDGLGRPISEIERAIAKITDEIDKIEIDEHDYAIRKLRQQIEKRKEQMPKPKGRTIATETSEYIIKEGDSDIQESDEEVLYKKLIRKYQLKLRLTQFRKGLQAFKDIESRKKSPQESYQGVANELEAVILAQYRPAIILMEDKNGNYYVDQEYLDSFGTIDGMDVTWKQVLQDSNEQEIHGLILGNAKKTGFIHSGGHSIAQSWVGTCFLTDKSRGLTNAHVLLDGRFYSRTANGEGNLRETVKPYVSFSQLYTKFSDIKSGIEKVPYIAEEKDVDFGLIQLDERSLDFPEGITLQKDEIQPNDLKGRLIYVIGHPGLQGLDYNPDIERLFEKVSDVKRIMPGKLNSENPVIQKDGLPALQHDASTLHGASGSCVVDLKTHKVLGLHWGGQEGNTNWAVPIWELLKRADKLKITL